MAQKMRHDSTVFLTTYLLQCRLLAFCILVCSLGLTSCATTSSKPAPVIEQPTSSQGDKESDTSKSSSFTLAQHKKNLSTHLYEVVKGDTLYSIGKKLGIPHQKIAQTNNIENNAIYVGQVLTISAENDQINQNDSSNVVIQPIKSTEMPIATETKPVKVDGASHSDYPKATENVSTQDAKPSDTTSKDNGTIDIDAIQDQNIEWRWPAKGKITAEYNKDMNKGIDIAGNVGQAIFAAGAGKVIYSGMDIRGYGKLVIIKHNRNFLSVYAHQGNILVKEGQFVTSNEKISEIGRDNTSTNKLHFEIRKNGKTVDPKEYLPNS